MNVNTMREALRTYYGSGSPFSQKLKIMSDSQILAVYLRLRNKGVIK